jgi:hypothetical protein
MSSFWVAKAESNLWRRLPFRSPVQIGACHRRWRLPTNKPARLSVPVVLRQTIGSEAFGPSSLSGWIIRRCGSTTTGFSQSAQRSEDTCYHWVIIVCFTKKKGEKYCSPFYKNPSTPCSITQERLFFTYMASARILSPSLSCCFLAGGRSKTIML